MSFDTIIVIKYTPQNVAALFENLMNLRMQFFGNI